MEGRWIGRDKELNNNLYEYINNSTVLLADTLGLKYILNETPEVLEVPKWALKGAIGGFLIRRGGIPGVNFITYPCLHKVEVPTVNITGTIKLIKEEEYLTTLFYLIEDRQNIHLSVEHAKEYEKKS